MDMSLNYNNNKSNVQNAAFKSNGALIHLLPETDNTLFFYVAVK